MVAKRKTTTTTKTTKPATRRRVSTPPQVVEKRSTPQIHKAPIARQRGYRCDTCGLTFRSCSGFDRHRVGQYEVREDRPPYRLIKPNTRHCLGEAELRLLGFGSDAETGVWAKVVSTDDRARFAALHEGKEATSDHDRPQRAAAPSASRHRRTLGPGERSVGRHRPLDAGHPGSTRTG